MGDINKTILPSLAKTRIQLQQITVEIVFYLVTKKKKKKENFWHKFLHVINDQFHVVIY